MPVVEEEFAKAIKGSKAEIRAKESHRRQLSRNTARKRANLAVIGARSRANQESAQARARAAQDIIAAREGARTQRIVNPPRQSFGSQVKGTAQNRIATGGTNAVISTATPSSNSNLIMTTLFVIVGLALFYNLVTKADQFSGFVGTVGDFLHKLSSTTPLFQTVATK